MPSSLKIIMANWNWYRFGGDWTYIENLGRLYERYGHEIIPFSMTSPRNQDAGVFEKYFVKQIDYKELNRNKNISNGLSALSRSIYSFEASNSMEALLSNHKVDVAHLHNINHYLTPSILPVFKRHKVPVIWTLHDYTLICPENSFISNKKICENCKGGRFYHCAIQKCKKESFLASSLAALENYVHRYMNLFKHVDYFLCPSEFLYNKFREFNFYPEKLILSNLCLEIENPPFNKTPEPYILYVGRLDETKGIMTLLKAVEGADLTLYIAGEGGQEKALRDYISANNLRNVLLLGYKPKEEVHELITKSMFVVCPSEWYENFPYSVSESLLLQTPVIGANIGGIPELVIHEKTGLLFEPGNFLDLRKNILRLADDKDLQRTLGENAYNHAKSILHYKQHYSILKSVYEKLALSL